MLRIALAVALAMAPAAAQTVPAPPPALARHLQEGGLDTADLSWLRGGLPDATPAEKAEWQSIEAWQAACTEASAASVRAELRAMGASLEDGSGAYSIGPCATVTSFLRVATRAKDWPSFAAAADDARGRFAMFEHGARLAIESTTFDPAWVPDGWQWLIALPTREQVYRKAMGWRSHDAPGPAVPDAIWPLLQAFISDATHREDTANTAVLKARVAKHGWPTIPKAGLRASQNAWLIVQHADHDPGFQLHVLRLMEPLAATGEVEKRNFAYLYDRVMLKLSGRQRYATQFGCTAGIFDVRPLEEPDKIDALRESMELEPLAGYRARMMKLGANCG